VVVAYNVTVPSVLGLSKEEARTAVEEAGLTAQIDWMPYDKLSNDRFEVVHSTAPAAGARVDKKASVILSLVGLPGVEDLLGREVKDVLSEMEARQGPPTSVHGPSNYLLRYNESDGRCSVEYGINLHSEGICYVTEVWIGAGIELYGLPPMPDSE